MNRGYMTFLRRSISLRLVPLFAVLLLLGGAALGGPKEKDSAEQLFEDGKKLLDAGKVNEAVEKFTQSYSLDPSGGTLAHLAKCHAAQGRTATASAELERVIEISSRDKRTDRAEWAQEQLDLLRPKLSWLRLKVTPAARDIRGIVIARDGQPLDPSGWDTPSRLDPGEHSITASAPGYRPWGHVVEMKEGDSISVEVPPLPVASERVIVPKLPRSTPVWVTTPRSVAEVESYSGKIVTGAILTVMGAGTVGGFFGAYQSCSSGGIIDLCRAGTMMVIVGGGAHFLVGLPLLITGIVQTATSPAPNRRPSVSLSIGPGTLGLTGAF